MTGTATTHRPSSRATDWAERGEHSLPLARSRLATVDAVRALALLGVLVMNLQDISGLRFLSPDFLDMVQRHFHSMVETLLAVLVDRKALSAFSFLFGLSFTLLLEGSRRRGEPFVPLYLRRLFFLAGFGILNAALFFWGDILTTYALLGLVLLPALWLPQKALLALAGLILTVVPLAMAAAGVLRGPGVPLGTDVQALAALSQNSLWATITYNLERFITLVSTQSPLGPWNYTNIVGLFLLGMWTGRAGIARNIAGHEALLRRVVLVALPVGLTVAVAEALTPHTSPLSTAMLAGTPILAVGYVAGAAMLLNRPGTAFLRDSLAPAGRMALTLYLVSGLIGEILFYGWGVGLLAQVGAGTVLLMTLAVYVGLLLLSRVWLARFYYGPCEWAWRCLTHLRWQPMHR